MRFMIIRRADAETEAEAMPTEALITAMTKFHEEMAAAGILRGGDGLRATKHGARLSFRDGVPTVTDGPFTEIKELIAGFSIIEVPTLQDAVAWIRRWPALDGHGNVELEIRPFIQAEDFGAEFTPEMRDAEAKMRAQIDQLP